MENNEAYNNIVSRTSVRRYESSPVPPEAVDAILHAAMSAPTGVNRQPWEFIVVNEPELLHRLAGALPYAKMVDKASVAIVVCGNSERFLEGDDSTLWVQDLSAASENILLAANALGLGAVWTALYPHADRETAVREILNIPSGVIPFNVIPVGYPLSHSNPMDKWHPDRTHSNGY